MHTQAFKFACSASHASAQVQNRFLNSSHHTYSAKRAFAGALGAASLVAMEGLGCPGHTDPRGFLLVLILQFPLADVSALDIPLTACPAWASLLACPAPPCGAELVALLGWGLLGDWCRRPPAGPPPKKGQGGISLTGCLIRRTSLSIPYGLSFLLWQGLWLCEPEYGSTFSTF